VVRHLERERRTATLVDAGAVPALRQAAGARLSDDVHEAAAGAPTTLADVGGTVARRHSCALEDSYTIQIPVYGNIHGSNVLLKVDLKCLTNSEYQPARSSSQTNLV
jgi:hypothetical protein